ncbi:MAG TPA: hypothetical protein VKP65_26085 [Rhodothermales bacterium]|nr:hypothetical protein [Rhodothermales bacterium]
MPIEHQIYEEYRLIHERIWGHVTAQDLVAYARVIWADEAYDKLFDGFIDFTGAELDMNSRDFLAISEFLIASPDANDGRLAILASTPTEAAFSFVLHAKLKMKKELAVFTSWESVREFLDLPPSVMENLTVKTGTR